MLKLRNTSLLAVATLLALAVTPAARAATAEESFKVGNVRIPRGFTYTGSVHDKGVYQVRIEPGQEGPYFVVTAPDGSEVARELAIVQDRPGRVSRPRASVAVLTRDEQMVRVIVRYGGKRYLAYFEAAS